MNEKNGKDIAISRNNVIVAGSLGLFGKVDFMGAFRPLFLEVMGVALFKALIFIIVCITNTLMYLSSLALIFKPQG